MPWHDTWNRMRAYGEGRTWRRFAEVMEQLRAEGLFVTEWDARKVMRQCDPQPERVYGHCRYEESHIEAVRAFARREGLVTVRSDS